MSGLPPKDWYLEWVAMHSGATAAGAEATAALIAAKDAALETWEATEIELWECTNRLLRTMRTPKFANEHVDAVGLELVALRRERTAALSSAAGEVETSCATCGGAVFIIAAHPACIRDGRLVLANGKVMTTAVLCDLCPRGLAEIAAQNRRAEYATGKDELWKKKKVLTLSTYFERVRGFDGVAMLRNYNRQRAADARRRDPRSEGENALFDRLLGKIQSLGAES